MQPGSTRRVVMITYSLAKNTYSMAICCQPYNMDLLWLKSITTASQSRIVLTITPCTRQYVNSMLCMSDIYIRREAGR